MALKSRQPLKLAFKVWLYLDIKGLWHTWVCPFFRITRKVVIDLKVSEFPNQTTSILWVAKKQKGNTFVTKHDAILQHYTALLEYYRSSKVRGQKIKIFFKIWSNRKTNIPIEYIFYEFGLILQH